MKSLPKHFYTMPKFANTTMDKKDLKELLLATDGCIISCGTLYNIESKHIGAGVYRVSLERKYK